MGEGDGRRTVSKSKVAGATHLLPARTNHSSRHVTTCSSISNNGTKRKEERKKRKKNNKNKR